MGKSPDEQPFLAAYKLHLAKLTLVQITIQLLFGPIGKIGKDELDK